MGQLFGNLTTDGLEEVQDRLGGFNVLESGAYTGVIKAAYAGKSSNSNAQSVAVILEHGGGEYRETFWITNQKGENFFTNKQGKRQPLPGFTHVNDLCIVTAGKELHEMVAEDKIMNVYDPEAKKEVPTSVPMLVELLGKQVTFGILKETKNKQVKDASGQYVDTADSRDENSTDKIFHHPTNMTVVEAKGGAKQATFFDAWVAKNKGVTRDRRSIKDGQAAPQNGRSGRPGMPPKAADVQQSRTTSLFGS